ncbi:hypothetical protein JTB14_002199 [Gonioctena quinquepunctata]|nr:hypothetical protein JTB14_002199 [Gonioctena quinquepunctata]
MHEFSRICYHTTSARTKEIGITGYLCIDGVPRQYTQFHGYSPYFYSMGETKYSPMDSMIILGESDTITRQLTHRNLERLRKLYQMCKKTKSEQRGKGQKKDRGTQTIWEIRYLEDMASNDYRKKVVRS